MIFVSLKDAILNRKQKAFDALTQAPLWLYD